jgi:hypothetical protein
MMLTYSEKGCRPCHRNPPEERVIDKLHPDRLQTSDKFTAILGALLGQDWTTPRLVELSISSDECLLGRAEGDVGFNVFLGSAKDLLENLLGVADAAGLTPEERRWLLDKARALR